MGFITDSIFCLLFWLVFWSVFRLLFRAAAPCALPFALSAQSLQKPWSRQQAGASSPPASPLSVSHSETEHSNAVAFAHTCKRHLRRLLRYAPFHILKRFRKKSSYLTAGCVFSVSLFETENERIPSYFAMHRCVAEAVPVDWLACMA
ncbi:MAG: hypothetical protein IKX79_05735 [Desulfovibrionaceae bacterium]|nr:hypothetical protein [Desulfovibrionaceae bacterium]